MAKELFLLPRINMPYREVDGWYTVRQASKNGFVFWVSRRFLTEPCAFNIACLGLRCRKTRCGDQPTGPSLTVSRSVAIWSARTSIAWTPSPTMSCKVERDFSERRFCVYNQWRKDWYAEYQTKVILVCRPALSAGAS